MGNHKGDEAKQPPECKTDAPFPARFTDCPNMKETYSDMEGEQYRCEVCGKTVYLDYEEMR